MSSPCLSGGGRAYGFEFEIVKSLSSTTTSSARRSHTSSPSSTLSESSNSPLAISTRKPRTPRKRPNQTYNEAAALLSTVYPNIFSTNHKFTNSLQHSTLLLDPPSDLLLPPHFSVFDTPGFLLKDKPCFASEPIIRASSNSNKISSCQSSTGEVDSRVGSSDSMEVCEEDDLDTESILDEEVEQGIDSIMGNLSVVGDCGGELNTWNPMGLNLGGKLQAAGMRRGVRALRNLEEGNWWCFPIVDMLQISPRLNNGKDDGDKAANWSSHCNSNSNPSPNSKSKLRPESGEKSKKKENKKKKKVEKAVEVELAAEEENWIRAQAGKDGLLLKLNYKEVLDAWSDRGSPFSEADEKDASVCISSPAGKPKAV